MSAPFRLYGHRGAAAHHPENTLRSFRAALSEGADAIETDVRLSSDGEVVIFHDESGARTASVPARLREAPWAEISRWDIGEGERPVRLGDLLEALPETFINVDVKDDDPLAAERTLDVVLRAGAASRVGLGSFHRRVARALLKLRWSGQLSLCPRDVAAVRLLPMPLARRLHWGDAVQIPTQQSGWRLDGAPFIARCHALGLRVDYWTIDDPAQAVALARAGADGIVTNDPKLVARALREAGLRP